MIQRLSKFPGVEFPEDGNIAEHLLRQINSTSCENAAQNVDNFKRESRLNFEADLNALNSGKAYIPCFSLLRIVRIVAKNWQKLQCWLF